MKTTQLIIASLALFTAVNAHAQLTLTTYAPDENDTKFVAVLSDMRCSEPASLYEIRNGQRIVLTPLNAIDSAQLDQALITANNRLINETLQAYTRHDEFYIKSQIHEPLVGECGVMRTYILRKKLSTTTGDMVSMSDED